MMRWISCLTVVAALATAAVPAWSQKIVAAYGQNSIFNSPIWIAQERGFFREQGIDVEVVQLAGARITDALSAGSAQFIMSSASTPTLLRLGGGTPKIVAILVAKTPYDIVVNPNKVKSVADLRGKVGALAALTDFTATATRLGLNAHGISPDRETTLLAKFRTDPDRIAAVLSGSADFTVINVDFREQYEKAGLKRLIAIAQHVEADFILSSIVTTEAVANTRSKDVLAFVKALSQALHYFHTQKEGTLDIVAKYSPRPRPELEASWTLFANEIMAKRPYLDMRTLERSVRAMAPLNPKAETADVGSFQDDRFIRQLEAEGFFARFN